MKYMANGLYCYLVMAYASLGEIKMKSGIMNERVDYKQLEKCIKLQLTWEKWTHEDQSMIQVEDALPAVTEVMLDLVKKYFPRPGKQGYKFPKFYVSYFILHATTA